LCNLGRDFRRADPDKNNPLSQLSLRDLFWLVLVCALAVAWWVDHRRLLAKLETVVEPVVVVDVPAIEPFCGPMEIKMEDFLPAPRLDAVSSL
jgi:hypothetical protein